MALGHSSGLNQRDIGYRVRRDAASTELGLGCEVAIQPSSPSSERLPRIPTLLLHRELPLPGPPLHLPSPSPSGEMMQAPVPPTYLDVTSSLKSLHIPPLSSLLPLLGLQQAPGH